MAPILKSGYPDEADLRIIRLNLINDEAKFIIGTFADITAFIHRKSFLAGSGASR
jgi:hypothetical protein